MFMGLVASAIRAKYEGEDAWDSMRRDRGLMRWFRDSREGQKV